MPGFNPFDVTTKRVLNKLGGDYTKNVFTFDGNPEGLETTADGTMVKISDKTPDSSDFVSARAISPGQMVEVTEKDCTALKDSACYVLMVGDITFAVVVKTRESGHQYADAEPGLYVACNTEYGFYVSYIEFAETIVPIDQKYLPGVCLPVVELTTEFPLDGAEVALTEAESKNMDKVATTFLPIVVSGMLAGGKTMYVFNTTTVPDGPTIYSTMILNSTLFITNESGAWVMHAESV